MHMSRLNILIQYLAYRYSIKFVFSMQICWSTNTHYHPFNEDLPKAAKDRQYISYYQWIPLFLAVQAIMFYLPRMMWRSLSRKSGIVVYNITDAAIECQRNTGKEDAEKAMQWVLSVTVTVRAWSDQAHASMCYRISKCQCVSEAFESLLHESVTLSYTKYLNRSTTTIEGFQSAHNQHHNIELSQLILLWRCVAPADARTTLHSCVCHIPDGRRTLYRSNGSLRAVWHGLV